MSSESSLEQVYPPATAAPLPGAVLQRKCGCGQHTGDGGECIQCKRDRVNRSGAMPSTVNHVVHSSGESLDPGTRQHMEHGFAHDFSQVRVHHDGAAAESARAVNAQAFTMGNHVVFGAGHYNPSTSFGRRLIAHELAHTLQQQRGSGGGSERAAERDADRAADAVQRGGPAQVNESFGTRALQRQAEDPAPPVPQSEKDTEQETIVGVTKRTGSLTGRAWELVWRLLSRYYPQYVAHISSVAYDEKEPSVRVAVKNIEVDGKKVQSATVTVGKRFVESASADSLRERIAELGLGLMRLSPDPEPQASPGQAAVWKIVNEKFPTKGRRLAGSAYDANLPGVRVDFTSGNVKSQGITESWSGPTLYFGNAFLSWPEPDKQKRLGEELAKVDKWCVENGRLFDPDLEDRDVKDRIRGLSAAKLAELRDKLTNHDTQSKIRAYVDSLRTMSTPLELGLTRQGNGNATVVIGNVTVVLQPDASNVANAPNAGGRTNFTSPGRPDPSPLAHFDVGGRLTGFDGFPAITITIRTGYAANADPDARSGYGRGTTDRDKRVGATSLRFHEGTHGLDFLEFVQNHPYPTFAWRVGMTAAQFNTAIAVYDRARARFDADMEAFSNQRTHCVGITIDELRVQRHIQAARECH